MPGKQICRIDAQSAGGPTSSVQNVMEYPAGGLTPRSAAAATDVFCTGAAQPASDGAHDQDAAAR